MDLSSGVTAAPGPVGPVSVTGRSCLHVPQKPTSLPKWLAAKQHTGFGGILGTCQRLMLALRSVQTHPVQNIDELMLRSCQWCVALIS